MHKTAAVLVTIVLSTLVATGPSPTPFASAASDIQYEVLSPWAESDSIPPRGTLAASGDFGRQENRAVPQHEARRQAYGSSDSEQTEGEISYF